MVSENIENIKRNKERHKQYFKIICKMLLFPTEIIQKNSSGTSNFKEIY